MHSVPHVSASPYSLFEDFSRYPDSSVMQGKVPRRGPAWSNTGASPTTTSGGFLINTAVSQGYLYTNLPGVPQVIGCKVAWSGGTTAGQKSAAAISFSSQMPGLLNVKNLLHYNFGPAGFQMGVFDTAGVFSAIFGGTFAATMNNTGTLYDTWLGLVGDTCVVGGPSGEQFMMTDSRWAPQWGAMVFWEPLLQADGLSCRMKTAYALRRAPLIVRPTTLNPNDKSATAALSNNNLTMTGSGLNGQARSIAQRANGKVHFEWTINTHATATSDNLACGIASVAEHPFTSGLGGDVKSIGVYPRGANTSIWINNAATSNLGTMSGAAGKVWACEVDFGANKIWFKNVTDATGWNNGAIGAQNPATALGGFTMSALGGTPYAICTHTDVSGDALTVNFGPNFAEPPSAGFAAWL